MNITNKLFIVKYVFVIDVNNNINRNFNSNLNKRENFDDANFDIIFVQNICVLNIVNDVTNNVNSLKLNITSKIKIVDEVKTI